MREHEIEPVPGLPERLPEGENILWQGRPSWTTLAVDAFHVRAAALYCAILIAWNAFLVIHDGGSIPRAANVVLWPTVLSVGGIWLLGLLAWLNARSTLYTITNRRIVMRFGVALPMTINLPFAQIAGAALKVRRDDVGDIPVTTTGPDRIAYLHLWPHVRPWHYRTPQPMLRAIPEASEVAAILGRAVATYDPKRIQLSDRPQEAAGEPAGLVAKAA
ncbi:MAG: photosynthetic complex putative assembly protein PuhB [Geminicoccaceae bacterium]